MWKKRMWTIYVEKIMLQQTIKDYTYFFSDVNRAWYLWGIVYCLN